MVQADFPGGIKTILIIWKVEVKQAYFRLVSGHRGNACGSRGCDCQHVITLRLKGCGQCIAQDLLIVAED